MKGNRIASLRTVAGLAIGALAATVWAGNARAEEEGVFMKDMLGSIGLIGKERPPIQYRERAPLVVPPRLDLRDPVAPGSTEARNPQWPDDPDLVEKRRRAADAKIPITEMERRRAGENNPRLSAEELRAGRRPGAGIPTEPVVRHGDSSRDELWVRPDVLRAQGRPASEPVVAGGAEPERNRLSQPPAGFRKPADGAVMRRDFEPIVREDEADPKAFIRQQNRR